MKVSKFGGTSLADSEQIRKVRKIVKSDPTRQYVVVSAPGKRGPDDSKITDLLYKWHRQHKLRSSPDRTIQTIRDRYIEIIQNLGISFDLVAEIEEIEGKIRSGASSDYVASRGEYLNGKIVAVALDYEFIDPATCIFFDEQGCYVDSNYKLQKALEGRHVVIPGFYGSMPDGSIKTFTRGGSDITGAIVASAVGADVYENWTDVSGLLMADPRIVQNPKRIERVTYRELRELSYMGANVFHEEATFPVLKAGIPTNIRNTNRPQDDGTYIVPERTCENEGNIITGVAGRKDFTVITVDKVMMNQEVGFVRRILTVLEQNGVSFEHMPSGIDNLSIIIDDKYLDGKLEKVLNKIREVCSPDKIEARPNMAMVAIVGQAMDHKTGVSARAFSALSRKGINIRMINQGSSETTIIIGVENYDYENTVNAIYAEFVG